ncbi:MAG: hypothetical protein ABSE56_05335 [Bryobacteraceae bacterium]
MKRIQLHVGELVLHGFPASERYRIAESMAAELGRLLSERGSPAGARSREEIRAGQFEARTGDVGAQVARAVYRGLENG